MLFTGHRCAPRLTQPHHFPRWSNKAGSRQALLVGVSSLKIIRLEPVLLRNLSALRLLAESLSVTAYCSLEPEADEPGLQRSDNKTVFQA